MHEIFDHTADLGLRIEASELAGKAGVFAEAGRALLTALTNNPESVKPVVQEEFHLSGNDHAFLLFDWLSELLHAHESRGMLFCDFDVRLSADGLHATALGEAYDPNRHSLSHEIKAITYHGLNVRKTNGGWRAEVIVDI
jgi:SHS2 domain-containing protein